MSGRVIGLDHVDIVVGNPDEMATFLAAAGFRVIRRTAGTRGSIELAFPGSDIVLELTPSRRADGESLELGLRHLALRCDDLDAAVTELAAAGFAFTGPVRTIADTGRRVANVTDPDGRVLQFTE
jgi:glyoxylase I family protein